MDTLPDDDVRDTEPVKTPVVYVVIAVPQYHDSSNKLWGVFTSIEELSRTVNAIPGMKLVTLEDRLYIDWKYEDDVYYSLEIVPLNQVIKHD